MLCERILCRLTMQFLATTLLISVASQAFAEAACQPITAGEIDDMWAEYASGDVAPNPADGPYECITSNQIAQVICRTIPGHPAHPSIVARTIVMPEGGYAIKTEASTAADCDEFLAMMEQWEAVNAEMMESLNKPQ